MFSSAEQSIAVNPVARLRAVIDDIARQDEGVEVRVVWERILGVEEGDDRGLLLVRIAEVFRLAHDAREVVERLVDDENKDLHLEPFVRLSAALSRLNLEAPSRELVLAVRSLTKDMRHAADFVRNKGDTLVFDKQSLDDLLRELEAMTATVLESGFPVSVRALLIQRLDAVRQAVLEIRLRGSDNLEDALDTLLGTAARGVPETEKKFWSGVGRVLDIGYRIVSVADKLPAIAGSALKLLGSITGIPPNDLSASQPP